MNQSGTNEIQELHASVRGQVQGVGYRYFVIEKARALGLGGYVRNERNGGVEVPGSRTPADSATTRAIGGPGK